jgi:hypothetical protein
MCIFTFACMLQTFHYEYRLTIQDRVCDGIEVRKGCRSADMIGIPLRFFPRSKFPLSFKSRG